MAFRRQRFKELCTVCKAATSSGCLRCGLPLCAEHRPPPDQRCDDCEQEWLARAPGADETSRLQRGSEVFGKVSRVALGTGKLGLALLFLWALVLVLLPSLSGDPLFWIGGSLLVGIAGAFSVGFLCTLLEGSASASDRAVDRTARKKFLRERKAAALLAPPEDDAP